MKELQRIKRENYSLLESKSIYFAGFSAANIAHFVECFPQYVKNISGIFAILDIDERTPLSVYIGGKTYKIMSLSDVRSLDTEKDVLIIMYEYEREAYKKILSIFGDDSRPIYWFPDGATEVELDYREKFKDCAVENVILFKSGSRQYVYGEDFGDNSRALFEYMIKNGYNDRWKLVWLVHDPSNKEYDDWKLNKNVEFVGAKDCESCDVEKRELYYKYLCVAKYAFVTDDEIFFQRRRGDQTLVQLWHGDGVKARTRHRIMENRWDYMVCTSQFYADVDYKDYGLGKDQMLSSGYPKDDWVISSNIELSKLLVDRKSFTHYILWGPTFRKSVEGLEILNEKVRINKTGLPLLTTWEDCDSINEILKEHDCLMLIKLHPVADLSLYSKRFFSNIVLMTNQDLYSHGLHINQIMSCFDAFITDYSSATASYMLLDRPMAFTLDDLDEYDDSRGFVLNPVRDYLPGEELYNTRDMVDFIKDVCSGKDAAAEKRRKLISEMIDYRDGRNSERLLSMLSIEK